MTRPCLDEPALTNIIGAQCLVDSAVIETANVAPFQQVSVAKYGSSVLWSQWAITVASFKCDRCFVGRCIGRGKCIGERVEPPT